MNQDPLENLFGGIRGGCGRSDNPTVPQFIGSIKTQIINGLSTRAIDGNCEEDDASILTNLHGFLQNGENNEEANSKHIPETHVLENVDDLAG